MANLTAEELDFIKTGSAEYTKIKIGLGELELQKQGLIKQAHTIVEAFTNNEKLLIEKYGADSEAYKYLNAISNVSKVLGGM